MCMCSCTIKEGMRVLAAIFRERCCIFGVCMLFFLRSGVVHIINIFDNTIGLESISAAATTTLSNKYHPYR